jgi:GntR family transcriptional regulator
MSTHGFIFELSSDDPVPVYHQLARAIQRCIENGSLTANDPIPPERDIAKLNGLSLSTVRNALQKLAQKGLLYRIQGKGTFVSNTELRRKNIRYYSLVKGFQGEYGRVEIKFLGLERQPAKHPVDRYLVIEPGEDVYELRRIVHIDGHPAVYCISYLPYDLVKGLEKKEPRCFEKTPLYILLEDEFGIPTMKNRDLYGAVIADRNLADVLGVREGHPLLLIETQALTHKEKPYEYRVSYCIVDERKIQREY